MKRKNGLHSIRMAPRAAGFALATMLPLAVSTASAFELNFGAVSGSLDTTLSYGTGWRVESVDPKLAGHYDNYPAAVADNRRTFINKNDGDANFDNDSKPISNVFKITSDLELKAGDYGVFVRGTAFYDTVLADERPNYSYGGESANAYFPNQPGNYFPNSKSCNAQSVENEHLCGFPSELDKKVSRDARVLDAYVYGNFEVGGRALNVRLGEQVINWGEALFLQDGINNANPVSLSKLRLPGAEVKEALLPLPMLYASIELADSLTMEAFYEFDWDYSEADGVGTFYSTDDAFAGDGANRIIVETNGTQLGGFTAAYNLARYGYETTTLTADRINDKPVDSEGQFGVAFRYNTSDSEFGLFYMNYHSHKPVAQATPGGKDGWTGDPFSFIDDTTYQIVYPEDIQMVGLSFSTTAGNLSLSGELAYRPNDVILAELGDNLVAYNTIAGICYFRDPSACDPNVGFSYGDVLNGGKPVKAGDTVQVWEELETYNLDLVAINNFGPMLGADQIVGVLEVGAWYAPKGEDKRYASTASLLNIPLSDVPDSLEAALCADGSSEKPLYEAGTCLSEGPSDDYMDELSWGYRAVLSATYNDVFAGVTLNPVVRFAHDVDGNSHRTGNFLENRKSGLVGVNAIYNNAFEVGVAYNAFWGAEASNLLHDRDNVTLTLKYSF